MRLYDVFIAFLSLVVIFLVACTTHIKPPALPSTPPPSVETFTVPQEFSPRYEQNWINLGDKIVNSKSKVINLYIGGHGGLNSIADLFILKIQIAQKQGKKIVGLIYTDAQSNHGRLVCYLDRYEFVQPAAFLMYHRIKYINPVTGEPLNLPISRSDTLGQVASFVQCIKKGILTLDDTNSIIVKHLQVIITKDEKFTQEDN